MKIAQARKLLTEDIGRMTLEQLQRHRVKLTDAWRESRADYGMVQAVRDGFYLPVGQGDGDYIPKDAWLTWNLSRRLDEAIERAGATEQPQPQGVTPAKTDAQDRERALRRKAYTFTTARKRAIQSLSGASTGVGFHVANLKLRPRQCGCVGKDRRYE